MAEPLRLPTPSPSPFLRGVPSPAALGSSSSPAEAVVTSTGLPWLPPSIPYLRLRFWLSPERPLRLPELPGSMLRGALGNALRRAACTMGPQQECRSCRLRRDCLYTRLFESYFEAAPPPFLRGLPTPPRPFVVDGGSGGERTIASGELFPFELLLFGQAAHLSAYALFAVERMGSAGLGWPRVPVRLERAEVATGERSWRTLFSEGEVRGMGSLPFLATFDPLTSPTSDASSERGTPTRRVRLSFSTPTRIQAHGTFLRDPQPRELVFAMVRRSLEMAAVHGQVGLGSKELGLSLEWTFHPLLEAASRLARADVRLRWKEADRYSNRQKKKIPLDGFVGTLDLEGVLGPFLPLFESARVLRVGKGATVGLGKVEWERVE